MMAMDEYLLGIYPEHASHYPTNKTTPLESPALPTATGAERRT